MTMLNTVTCTITVLQLHATDIFQLTSISTSTSTRRTPYKYQVLHLCTQCNTSVDALLSQQHCQSHNAHSYNYLDINITNVPFSALMRLVGRSPQKDKPHYSHFRENVAACKPITTSQCCQSPIW